MKIKNNLLKILLIFISVTTTVKPEQGNSTEVKSPGTQFSEAISHMLTNMLELKSNMLFEIGINKHDALTNAKLKAEMLAVDVENLKILRFILQNYDWINFGQEPEGNMIKLTLLAKHDLPFQEEVLAKLEKLHSLNQVNPVYLALLYDNIAVGKGKPQLYGTQMMIEDGELVPVETEDMGNLSNRRESMNFPGSMNEQVAAYKKTLEHILIHEDMDLQNSAEEIKPTHSFVGSRACNDAIQNFFNILKEKKQKKLDGDNATIDKPQGYIKCMAKISDSELSDIRALYQYVDRDCLKALLGDDYVLYNMVIKNNL